MTSTSQERIPKRLIGAIVAVGSLAFIGILTETVMTVLFPELMTEFGVNTATVQWITTVYLLVVAATMPLSSFLNRRFRLKSLFIAAVVLAVTGSAIMIVGHTFPVILLARVIQGIGSGVATPLMMNIILEQSPRSKVGRLMGVGSLVITVAPAIGPTVGGAVSSVLPWRAIFVIAIPIVLLVSLPLGLHCIEQKRPTEDARLNPVQFVAIVLALSGMILALNQMGVAVSAAVNGSSATRPVIITVVSLVVGVGSLVFFGWSSSRSFSPLIRLGWLRDRVVQLHLLAYLILPIVGIGFGYVITNLAQMSLGTSAFHAGVLVLPGALVGAFFAPVGGMLYDKFGPTKPILSAISDGGVKLLEGVDLTPGCGLDAVPVDEGLLVDAVLGNAQQVGALRGRDQVTHLVDGFGVDVLELIGEHVGLLRQIMDGGLVVVLTDDLEIGHLRGRTVRRRVEYADAEAHVLRAQCHHAAELSAADDADGRSGLQHLHRAMGLLRQAGHWIRPPSP